MKVVALITIFLFISFFELCWSVANPNEAANTNSRAVYLATLDGVRQSIDGLIATHDSLLKDNKGDEAAMLREQLLSLQIPLYRLQYNGGIPPQPGQIPQFPGFNTNPSSGSESGSESGAPFDMPNFPPDMPDALKMQIQESLRNKAAGNSLNDFAASRSMSASRDMKRDTSFMGGRGSLPPHLTSQTNPQMNAQINDMKVRDFKPLSTSTPPIVPGSPASAAASTGDVSRAARTEKFIQFLRQRADDMTKRADSSASAAANSAEITQLKADIEKYYLAEVNLINMMEDDADRMYQFSKQQQTARMNDPFDASKRQQGSPSTNPFEASKAKLQGLSNDPFEASRQKLMQSDSLQRDSMTSAHNSIMEKREQVTKLRSDVMSRLGNLEAASHKV